MPKILGLITASGFAVPRHGKAITETGNDLAAALNPSGSSGIIATCRPGIGFFTGFGDFGHRVGKLRRMGIAATRTAVGEP